ncbi:hypothetical protein MKX03_027776, partial [Papaver bracteatum]
HAAVRVLYWNSLPVIHNVEIFHLASGDIMVSYHLGDKDGNAEGNGFLLLDSEFNVKGRLAFLEIQKLNDIRAKWFQPRHNTVISTSRGAPLAFTKSFNPQNVSDGLYGRHIYVYSWPGGELKQTLDLGNTGMIPLEIRFLHEPSRDTGYVGCALSSNMVRFFKNLDDSWSHEVSISVKPLKVKNWILPEMPGLVTDFLISLDDGYMYFVNWLHGDARQYNIEDPKNPVLKGQLWQKMKMGTTGSVMFLRTHTRTHRFLYNVLLCILLASEILYPGYLL